MYLAVALRHHEQSVRPVVDRLAEILGVLQKEVDNAVKEGVGRGPTKIEVERTMVLVIACFKTMILNHSYDKKKHGEPSYPDPSLLHESESPIMCKAYKLISVRLDIPRL